MTTQPTAAEVLVIQPCDDDALGRFEGWLTEHGIALHTVRPYAGDAVPARLAADGLIVLGGDMSSNDDAEYPWLEDIRALYRDAVRRDRPTLGICLGGQLLAQSLGGTVVAGAAGTEAGLVQVTLTAEAAGDPLFGGLAPDVPVASMHGDAIAVLPEDSVLLATGQTYPHQAFRAAPRAWGVQFHPEIAPATYAAWAVAHTSTDADEIGRVRRGIDHLTAADAAVQQVAATLATRFAATVLAAADRTVDSASEPVAG